MFDLSKYKREFLSTGDVIFWLVSFTVCGLGIVLLNLAVILTFMTNKILRRRSVCCLIHLAIADILYGIAGTIYGFCMYGFTLLNLDVYPTFCRLLFLSVACTLLASVLSLVIVSLERVSAFFLPFRHRVASRKIYIAVFVVSWIVALIITVLAARLPNLVSIIIGYALMALSVVTIFSSYFAIYIKVKKHSPQEIQNQPSFSQRRQIQEKKLAKTLGIVTVLSVMTWVPYIAYRFSYLHLDQDDLFTTHPNAYSLVSLFQRMNSIVNPIVYLFRMRDFRKAFFQLMCRSFFNRSRRVDGNSLGHHNEVT